MMAHEIINIVTSKRSNISIYMRYWRKIITFLNALTVPVPVGFDCIVVTPGGPG